LTSVDNGPSGLRFPHPRVAPAPIAAQDRRSARDGRPLGFSRLSGALPALCGLSAARCLACRVETAHSWPQAARRETGGMWRKTLEKVLGRKRITQARAIRRAAESPVFYVKHVITKPHVRHRLHEIGRFCGTDKADEEHTFYLSYLDVYERYFEPIRDEPIRILEIGVKEGSSLRMWKSYFRNGLIYDLDINPDSKTHEEDRISIEIGSQDDSEFLCRSFGGTDKFDVIIDDGSHVNRHMLASFECLFNERLSSGGIYVMEDLWCSYQQLQTDYNVLELWSGMKYNDQNQNYNNNRRDMDRFFLNKIKALDYFEGNILAMHFWSNMCFIVKV
jgi:hypothetical protein